jgi:hypothetical protein
LLRKKEEMLYELKKQKMNSENELKLMAAKLYKAKQDGVSIFIIYLSIFVCRNLTTLVMKM